MTTGIRYGFLGLDPAFFNWDSDEESDAKVQDWYQFIKDRLNEAGIDPTAIEFVYLGGASRGGALSYLPYQKFLFRIPTIISTTPRIVCGEALTRY